MKKLMSLFMVVVLIFSFACVNVSASTEVALKNGAKLVMYDDNEVAPFLRNRGLSEFNFSISPVAVCPQVSSIKSSSGVRNIELGSGCTSIGIEFDSAPSERLYFSVYDVTTGEYLTEGTNNLYGPIFMSRVFSFEDLTAGHEYRINLSACLSGMSVSGYIYTY